MEEEPPSPPTPASPFWLSDRHKSRHNILLNTGLHVAFLSVAAIVLMAVVTPSLLSHAQQFFRPSSFKRGWGSVNIVLVAFAIVCGFLRRKGDEDADTSPQYMRSGQHYSWESYGDEGNVGRVRPLRRASSSYPDLIRQEMIWDPDQYDRRPRYYDDSYYVDRYNKSPRFGARSSSSIQGFRSQKLNGKEEKDDVKIIEVDHSVGVNAPNESTRPPPPPPAAGSIKLCGSVGRRVSREAMEDQYLSPRLPPPPPPPPLPAINSTTSVRGRRAPRQEYEIISVRMNEMKESSPPPPPPPAEAVSVGFRKGSRQQDESNRRRVRREGQGRRKLEAREDRSPPPPPPPPQESGSSSSQQKRGGLTKEKITSIYQQTKKKKTRRRSHENLEDLIPTNLNLLFPPPPPPPLPPPPPQESGSSSSQQKRGGLTKEKITSIYQQTKKKKTRRRSHENLEDLIPTNLKLLFPPPSPPPPPPPPPPLPSFFHNIFSSKKGRSSKKSPPRPPPPPPPSQRRRPPLTKNPRNFDRIIDKIGGNGSDSPSYTIPPPPPPPPFKVPAWKFVVQGDYVKINGSPLREDDSEESTPTAAKDTASPLFFPSPDVNMKADDFIARFRAKLNLEKMNSIRNQNQGSLGTSFFTLGPDSSPSPT